jgi:hypothetical protein
VNFTSVIQYRGSDGEANEVCALIQDWNNPSETLDVYIAQWSLISPECYPIVALFLQRNNSRPGDFGAGPLSLDNSGDIIVLGDIRLDID